MKEYIKTHKKQLLIIAIVTVLCLAVLFTAMYFTGVFDNYNAALKEVDAPVLSTEAVPVSGSDRVMYSATVSGSIKNIIRTTISGIQFRFYLLDENNNVIKDFEGNPYIAEDIVMNLEPGETYVYRATMILPVRPSGFRILPRKA